MTIKIKINDYYNDELILSHLKHHLIQQGISEVLVLNNKLLLKNKFFNTQSRMNRFAYIKDGYLYTRHFETYGMLYYKYSNFKFPLYIFFALLFVSFFWKIFRIFTLIFFIITFLNQFIYHLRQKNFIKKKISEFMSNN
ncbi:hypothetical protein IRZ83_14135 [Flavobacterium sp. JLP]|uniref:hypothetical protein n=1 Tax=Flavobacterium sp. JLP TaxID=2783793 RepID=UPI00188D3A34|nr:hypothetical protein [Flavobacterium sp. JLP]MBF4507811.1 hypothetical protein [Flavobacterium sp. JLP]